MEKNYKMQFVILNANIVDLSKDAELLEKYNKQAKVLLEINNKYKRKQIHQKILCELLDYTDTKEILTHRKTQIKIAEEKKQQQKLTSEYHFPNIKWREINNENVQLAVLLWTSIGSSWKQAKEISEEIQTNPNKAADLVETMIINKLAWEELTNYNNNGDFLWKHPILAEKKTQKEFLELKSQNPEAFCNVIENINRNIRRYKTYLKKQKYKDESEKIQYETSLQNYNTQKDIISKLL